MDSSSQAQGPWRRTSAGPGWGLGILAWLFAWVPPRVAYVLVLPAICHWYTHFNQPRFAVARAMGRLGCRWPLWTAFKAYAQYAFVLVDRFYVRQGRLRVAVEPEGRDLLATAVEEPGPIVLLGGHCGALEMAMEALEDLGRPVHPVAVADPGAGTLFQGVGDPTRGFGFGRQAIVADGSVASGLRMLQVLRAGEALGFKADRVLPGTAPAEGLEVDFAGAPALLPAGPLRIIGLGKARAVVVSAFRTGPARFELLADAMDVTSKEPAVLGQHFADLLQDHIRRRPDQWFNFYPFWPEDEGPAASLPRTIPPWFRSVWPGALALAATWLLLVSEPSLLDGVSRAAQGLLGVLLASSGLVVSWRRWRSRLV